MGTNKEIQDKIAATIDAMDSVEEVKVSPFLKDRILHNMTSEIEPSETMLTWFTPKLQLATLVLFIALNVFAYVSINNTDTNNEINKFAEAYGLSQPLNASLFN